MSADDLRQLADGEYETPVRAFQDELRWAADRIEELERREQFYRAKLRDYVEDVAGPDTTAAMGVIDKMAARFAGEVTTWD